MINNSSTGTIIRSGVEAEQAFRIKASAKAFKILSSGLYANKIRAIVRELSANAYDAHKEANNLDIPFVINIPNCLDPVFKIRDYGTGITPDNITTVYTTYFESPKTDSNDYIGCMGLGSKTPLCYTDSFTVINYYNGKKYFYNAYLNEYECPTLALLGEEDTTEHNGLEVMFNVKQPDFYRFREEVEHVLCYYKTPPKIEGDSSTEVKPVKYTILHADWGLRESSDVSGLQAIMGNIAYHITNSSLLLHKNILNLDIDVFFNIGDFEVTASREDISYDKESIKNITNRINKICNEIQAELDNEFSKATHIWEAKRIYAQFYNKGNVSKLFQKFKGNWNGSIIDSYMFVLKSLTDKRYEAYPNTKILFKTMAYDNKIYPTNDIDLRRNIIFVINDTKYAIRKRLQSLRASRPPSEGSFFVIIQELEPGIWEKYRAEFLPSDIIVYRLNDIDYEKTVYENDIDPIYQKSIVFFDTDTNDWEVPEKFDINTGGIYIPIKRFKYNGIHAYEYITDMLNVISVLNGNSNITVYGVKEKKLHLFQTNPKWKTLNDYCKDEFEKHPLHTDIINYFLISNIHGDYETKKFITVLLPFRNHLMDTILYDVFPFTQHIEDKYRCNNIRIFVNKNYREKDNRGDLYDKCIKILTKYCPLFLSANDLACPTYSQHLLEYLKAFLPKKP